MIFLAAVADGRSEAAALLIDSESSCLAGVNLSASREALRKNVPVVEMARPTPPVIFDSGRGSRATIGATPF